MWFVGEVYLFIYIEYGNRWIGAPIFVHDKALKTVEC